MIKYVSVHQMREIEREADEIGVSYSQMMTSAGEALAKTIHSEFSPLMKQGVLGLIGTGNNGGDTLVALAWLAENGWTTTALFLKPRPDTDPLIHRFRQAGGTVFYRKSDQESSLRRLLQTHSVLVDGLLGTGSRLPLKPEVADLLSKINEIISNHKFNHLKVVAVDCPSGIDCDSGDAAPEVIPAHITVTMAAIKQGLLKFPAYSLVGRLTAVEIGLPVSGTGLSSWQSVKTFIPDSKFLREILPPRDLNSHKGTFGTTLI